MKNQGQSFQNQSFTFIRKEFNTFEKLSPDSNEYILKSQKKILNSKQE
jgi:hypothetical protein